MKPQKNVPQAEHMPHVMRRARSSKSSGRVRQIKQRSAEFRSAGAGAGAVVLLGSTVGPRLARFRQHELSFLLRLLRLATHGCSRCVESVEVCVGVLIANMCEMQLCARNRVHSLQVACRESDCL